MYLLLIAVHSLFILVSHFFGYYVIEGVFLVLMLFFLLYFSPVFFFKHSKSNSVDVTELFTLELSPQKSLIIPLVLTYLGIYILAFTFSGTIAQSIHTHILIFLSIFAIILGYIFSFSWKHSVFFDVLGFHLIFSYITLIIAGFYYFFFRESVNFIDVIFTLVTTGFSVFFFLHDEKIREKLFYPFLISIFFSIAIILFAIFPKITFVFLFGILAIFAIILFEAATKSSFFDRFRLVSRVFLLWMIIGATLILSVSLFWDFTAIYFLIVFIVFLFSVHIRFSNIVAYSLAIAEMFLLYAFLFISLLGPAMPFFSLIFIFFFPMILIASTYFWEENQKYDFAIMHYSGIIFSIAFFVYSLIFITWENSFIFSSFGFLLLAAEFFLSYFRFYKK